MTHQHISSNKSSRYKRNSHANLSIHPIPTHHVVLGGTRSTPHQQKGGLAADRRRDTPPVPFDQRLSVLSAQALQHTAQHKRQAVQAVGMATRNLLEQGAVSCCAAIFTMDIGC